MLSVVVAAAALAVPVHAAPEFFGVPNSDRVLQGSLKLPDGRTVRFGSREGTLVGVRDDARHYWVAFQGVFERGASPWRRGRSADISMEETRGRP